jgi:hypothetical protein
VAYLSGQPRALDAVHRDLQVYLAEGLVEDRCNAIPVDPFGPVWHGSKVLIIGTRAPMIGTRALIIGTRALIIGTRYR